MAASARMSTDTYDLLDATRAYVLRTVQERGVRFIRLWFVDVLGLLKSFAIPVTELQSALEDGIELDGSAPLLIVSDGTLF